MYEAGIMGYTGRFRVNNTLGASAIANANNSTDGFKDRRAAATFIMYPQPWGIEAEWTSGQGPQLNDARTRIEDGNLNGGYIMVNYRHKYGQESEMIPYVRWNYFDGARKFGANAYKMCVNEMDFGFEWQWRKEVELQLQYTLADERSNGDGTAIIAGSRRLALQLQFNY
jgi:hypothetical protein